MSETVSVRETAFIQLPPKSQPTHPRGTENIFVHVKLNLLITAASCLSVTKGAHTHQLLLWGLC